MLALIVLKPRCFKVFFFRLRKNIKKIYQKSDLLKILLYSALFWLKLSHIQRDMQ